MVLCAVRSPLPAHGRLCGCPLMAWRLRRHSKGQQCSTLLAIGLRWLGGGADAVCSLSGVAYFEWLLHSAAQPLNELMF